MGREGRAGKTRGLRKKGRERRRSEGRENGSHQEFRGEGMALHLRLNHHQ